MSDTHLLKFYARYNPFINISSSLGCLDKSFIHIECKTWHALTGTLTKNLNKIYRSHLKANFYVNSTPII